MLAIEKNIPMPEARSGRQPEGGYPFQKMKVGDSFLVPVAPKTSPKTVTARRRLMNSHCQKAKARTGYQFSLRTMKNGIRVWRVK